MVTDFDGTAAAHDVQQEILDALADRDAWRAVNREWSEGRMTTAERARRQWALIRGGESEVLRVLDGEQLDPGFPAFARWCAERGYPIYIVSDGFDLYIRPLLLRAALGALTVIANRLRYVDGAPEMDFLHQRSPDQYYGNDKTYVIEGLRQEGSLIVYFGDGFSDRAAAHAADVLYAKDTLAAYCDEVGLQYRRFSTFDDVLRDLAGG